MRFPFTFYTHPLTGKRRLYPGNAAMAYNVGRYLVPLARRNSF